MTNLHLRTPGMIRLLFITLGTALSISANMARAQGVVVGDPYDQTRTSGFTYYGPSDGAKHGLLKTETVEPGNAQLCVTTTYDYNDYGNKVSAVTANCSGATGIAAFTQRGSSSVYASQTVAVAGVNATVPAGAFATTSTNARTQSETKTYDPRFGAVQALTGPNGLATTWQFDDFGRTIRETRADGTGTVSYYCYISGRVSDLSTNSAGCPTPGANEIPVDAIAFVHTESRNTSDAKSGPFVRVHSDKAGRKIRSVTEAFDGSSQPGGTARLIVQDTDYSPYGLQTVATQPYFLDTTSSLSSGNSAYGMSLTVYDPLGRPTAVYAADTAAVDSNGNSLPAITFGTRGSRPAAVTLITYTGLTTNTTNDKGQVRTEKRNVDGKVVHTTDPLGAQAAFQHDAFGNLVVTKDALQNQIIVGYDARGRKVSMTDPDTGLWKYDYDALGQLVWQQSPNQRNASQATTMAYDVLGRMTSRSEPEYVSTWSYDKNADGSYCMAGNATTRGAGRLCESNTSNGINRKVAYDTLGRPASSRTTVTNGPGFASAVGYDAATGRLASQTYPTGLQVNYNYTGRGYLSSLTLATAATVTPLPATPGGSAGAGTNLAAGALLWRADAFNAWGKAEQQTYGNNVASNAAFDATTGRLSALTAGASGGVLNQSYVWDSLSHLMQRNDANGDGNTGAVTDSFGYDSLGRLTSYSVAAPQVPNLHRDVTLQYNALGMLLYKSDVGNYTYGAQNTAGVRPHALLKVTGTTGANYGYDANGNLASADGGKYRNITYTSFNLPDSNSGAQGPGGSPTYTWQYDENHQRVKEVQVSGAGTRTTWNLHPDNQGGLGFESETSTASPTPTNRHYLSVGGAAIGVLVSRGALPTLAAGQMAPTVLTSITLIKVEYWHKDHLGSLITTTDHSGAVTKRYAYDPFGKRRGTNGTYDAFGALVIDWTSDTNSGTDRGYTGHEHLDDIGVVHMNGRLFDPTLGRFMQGDPMIQDPLNLQNYDRYGYCYNNPMGCTDPSGFCFLDCFWQPKHNPQVQFLKSIDNQVMKLTFALIRNAPGQRAIDNYMLSHEWAYAIGMAAASYWGGALGAAFVSGYANYIQTGSTTEARRTGAIVIATAVAFWGVGEFIPAARYPVWNAVGHAAVGCAQAEASGGSCRAGALSGGVSAAAGNLGLVPHFGNDLADIAVQMVVGGTSSALGGGTFSNGAITAAMGYIFNALGHKTIKDLFNLKGSAFSGELRGHHKFDEALAGKYDDYMTPDAINAASTDRIGQGYTNTGLPGDPHRWNDGHIAATRALDTQMDDWITSGRISKDQPMSQRQYYEFMNEAGRLPAVSNFWKSIQNFVDLMQSQGIQPKLRGMPRPRGITE